MSLGLWAEIFYWVTLLGYITFCVLFTRSHWWRTALGRHIMAFMFVPTVLLGLGALRRVALWTTGSATWFDTHRDGLLFWSYLSMAIVVWWRCLILVIAQAFNPEPALAVPEQGRVVVEGNNQSVHVEGDDTDPNILEPIRD